MKIRFQVIAYSFLFLLFLFPALQISAQNTDAVVNEYTQHCLIDKGKLTVSESLTITIFNRRGEKYTEFFIPYNKNNIILNIDAWLEDLAGKPIRKISKKEIESMSAISGFSLYEDEMIKHFILRHNTYPYKIRCEYTTESKQFLFITNWNPLYGQEIPTINANLIVDIPADYEVNIKQKQIENPQILEQDGRKLISWKSEYKNPVEEEIYSPPIETFLPSVKIVPKNFIYGIPGNFESWQSYGEWHDRLIEGLQDLPLNEKFVLDKILIQAQTQKEKITALYRYMQDNTRYINITVDIGGLKPYPASYVAYNKYGDCKALSNYMMAILNYAGIKSYYTKVYGGDYCEPLDNSFPNQQFNHIILCVPQKSDTTWLECTSNTFPAGYLGTFTQNRDVLLVDSNRSRIIKTPELTEKDVRTTTRYTINLSTLSSSEIEIIECLRGEDYELFAEKINLEYDKNKQEDLIRRSITLPNFELLNWSIQITAKDSVGIKYTIKLNTSGLISKYGTDYIAKLVPAYIPKFEQPSKRKQDLWFSYPLSTVDTLIYNFPNGLTSSFIPEKKYLDTKYGHYSISVENTNNKIKFIRKLLIYPGKYPVSEYPDFYSFIQAIHDLEKQNVIVLK